MTSKLALYTSRNGQGTEPSTLEGNATAQCSMVSVAVAVPLTAMGSPTRCVSASHVYQLQCHMQPGTQIPQLSSLRHDSTSIVWAPR